MTDLFDGAIRLGVRDGREYVEFPSQLFVLKCDETFKSRKPGDGPLSPP